jgi:predicted amidohydrolase
MRDIRVAAVQMEHAAGDKAANLAKIESFANLAAGSGVELIVFPEMCVTGYWFVRNLDRDELSNLAESVPDGPTTSYLKGLSHGFRMTIGAGLIEESGGSFFNCYVIALPDGRVVRHRKIHAFENEHISPGNEFTVFDAHECRFGALICYDNNIIENPRINALMGAEILLAPHQTGGTASGSPRGMRPIDAALWANRAQNPQALRAEFQGSNGRGWLMRWLPSRAHDNGMFLIFSNGVGWDDGEIRTGHAMIIDPYGAILAESDSIGDDMVIADLDASQLPMSSGRRWLRARRPDLYTPLTIPTGIEQDTRIVRFEAEIS